MSTSPQVNARVTHRFNTSAERVFDAWLSPELIGTWMFGSALRDEEVVRIAVDARVGGTFSFVVRREGQELDHTGEYLEIDRPRRLVFTWGVMPSPDFARVYIDIVPLETGCELTLTHELHPDWADFADRAAGSWSRMLDRLDAVLGERAVDA
jgi:uncharacterized protein YndB with AHSA1/START domain